MCSVLNNEPIKVKAISSIEKIYDTDEMPNVEFKGFSILKNEKKSFQIAIEVANDCQLDWAYDSTIKNLKAYTVEHVKSDLPMFKKNADDYYRYSKSGYYPDLLLSLGSKITAKKGINAIWFEIDGALNEVGKHQISITIGSQTTSIDVEIINAELDFKDFIYTCWFHTDCLASYYKFDVFSEEYWRVSENFLKTAVEYGMTCVLTPLFTPPLDTAIGKERPTVQLVDVNVDNGVYSFNFDKLTRWIEMATKCGIKYFELSHLYTQWGAKHAPKIMATVDGKYKQIFGWKTNANSRAYKDFLYYFSQELKKYLELRKLKDRVFIHVSDEPNLLMLPSYSKASRYVNKLFAGYKVVDALSEYRFYKWKIVSSPIPANDHIDKFIGNVDNLWVYYCSAQCNHNVANRFFCNDSIRTRVIGYQMYKFNIKGFLQWGFNFYYTRLSKALVNPFEVTDAGKEFPSGDSFMVYPAKDGTPYHSLRLKVFFDALQDMASLNTLEKLTDKETCLSIIEENGKFNLTFRDYPHDNDWLLSTREKINSAIKANVQQ